MIIDLRQELGESESKSRQQTQLLATYRESSDHLQKELSRKDAEIEKANHLNATQGSELTRLRNQLTEEITRREGESIEEEELERARGLEFTNLQAELSQLQQLHLKLQLELDSALEAVRIQSERGNLHHSLTLNEERTRRSPNLDSNNYLRPPQPVGTCLFEELRV